MPTVYANLQPARSTADFPANAGGLVSRWWGSLSPEQRAECRALWRETAAQGRSPVVVQLEVVEAHDETEQHDDWRNHFEYFLQHDGVGFFAEEPRVFHICRRHATARAVVRSGVLPAGFSCPLGRAGACPLRRIGDAAGRAVRFTPIALGAVGCPDRAPVERPREA